MTQIHSGSRGNHHSISVRCPHCRHAGAFLPIHSEVYDAAWSENVTKEGKTVTLAGFGAGVRKCPRPECRGLLLVSYGPGFLRTYPPELIDFDGTSLPVKILDSLEEAIKCHSAGAYRAAALMVRRLLEDLCEDRAATGSNLAARLQNLGAGIVVPTELIEAAHELRLLGNDAAHVEAKSYDTIGQAEAALAIELAKELLKAVYQYQSLVDRLRALKKPVA